MLIQTKRTLPGCFKARKHQNNRHGGPHRLIGHACVFRSLPSGLCSPLMQVTRRCMKPQSSGCVKGQPCEHRHTPTKTAFPAETASNRSNEILILIVPIMFCHVCPDPRIKRATALLMGARKPTGVGERDGYPFYTLFTPNQFAEGGRTLGTKKMSHPLMLQS